MAKITDFGLAKQLIRQTGDAAAGPETRTGAVMGTPGYMAPEQAAGRNREVGPAADIYALGAILYELLTGRPPFQADTPLETAVQVLQEDPLPPRRLRPKLPRDLETICLKCLHKEARSRYADADALADDLRRFRAGEPIRARPAGPLERAVKWARRRPALAALLAVSAAAALALLVGGLWHNAQLQAEVARRAAKEAEARRQQQLAVTHYREARAALDRILARLGTKEFVDVPRLQELRQQQLEDALAFYQAILKEQDAPDSALRFDAARAYEQAARIESLLDRDEAARAHAAGAEALLRALTEEDPANRDYSAHLVSCLNLLGSYHATAGQSEQAEAHHREAIRRCEDALRADPESPDWRYALADSHRFLGNLHLRTARYDRAGSAYAAGRELAECLVHDHPDNARYRVMLAEFDGRLGHLRVGGPEQAEQSFRRAEEQFQQLIGDHPAELSYPVFLGSVYCNWGNLRQQAGRPQAALDLFERGIGRMQAVLRREPHYTPAQGVLCSLHGSRAYSLGSLKRYADALPDWDKVIELEKNETNRDFRRSERACILAVSGDYVQAMAEVTALAAKAGVEPRALYNAAFAAATAAAAVQRDLRVTSADRDRLADEYATEAVRLLARVKAAGLFPPEEFQRRLKDEDLDLLRARADFQQLLASAP